MKTIQFEVLGIPQTAGSKRSFVMRRKGEPLVKDGKFNGRVVTTDDNPKGVDWKNRVADAGNIAMAAAGLPFDRPLFEGPLEVHFIFRMPRPKGHYRPNGELKPNAPTSPITRPDALKMARCGEDALTGVCWRDDSQIVVERLVKLYSERPGMVVTITTLPENNRQEPTNHHHNSSHSEPELAL